MPFTSHMTLLPAFCQEYSLILQVKHMSLGFKEKLLRKTFIHMKVFTFGHSYCKISHTTNVPDASEYFWETAHSFYLKPMKSHPSDSGKYRPMKTQTQTHTHTTQHKFCCSSHPSTPISLPPLVIIYQLPGHASNEND